MAWFELRTSGVGSDRSTNRATTTGSYDKSYFVIFDIFFEKSFSKTVWRVKNGHIYVSCMFTQFETILNVD